MKKLCIYLLMLTFVFSLTGCGSVNRMEQDNISDYAGFNGAMAYSSAMKTEGYVANDSISYNTGGNYKQESVVSENVSDSKNTPINQTNAKIIYNGQINISTSNIIKTEEIVAKKITEYGGYVSNYDKNDSSYINIVARIPSENFTKFMDDKDIAEDNTVSKSMSSEDVTLQYSDTEAEMESLKIQEERLLSYLASAENVSDMMTIEQTLQEVRRQITTVANRLKYLDNYISYSELHIRISARYIAPLEDASFFEKIKYEIINSFDNFCSFVEEIIVLIINLFPYIVSLIVVFYILRVILKKRKAKKQKNKENK